MNGQYHTLSLSLNTPSSPIAWPKKVCFFLGCPLQQFLRMTEQMGSNQFFATILGPSPRSGLCFQDLDTEYKLKVQITQHILRRKEERKEREKEGKPSFLEGGRKEGKILRRLKHLRYKWAQFTRFTENFWFANGWGMSGPIKIVLLIVMCSARKQYRQKS